MYCICWVSGFGELMFKTGDSVDVMLCYVMLCYVFLCYVILCYVMLCVVDVGSLVSVS